MSDPGRLERASRLERVFARESSFRFVLIATLLAYANSLTGPFQFDDHGVIERYEPVHSLSGTLGVLFSGLRPLLKLSYALCYELGGAPLWFHVFNLLVHLANLELVRRLFVAASAADERWPFAVHTETAPARTVAAGANLVALVFALHPIQTEAVTYISGRSSSLMTSFVLIAVLLHAEGARSGRRVFGLLWSPLAFLFALATKEAAAILPLGLLFWDLLIERASLRLALRRQLVWWGLVIGAGLVLVMNERYFSLLYDVLGTRSLSQSISYQLGGLAYLAARLALLAPLCIDPGLWMRPPSHAVVVLTALLLFAVVALAVHQARRRPLFSFGIAWFVLQSFLLYVVLPRTDVINERHAYLSNAGLFLALPGLFSSLAARWRRVAPALPWVLALVLGFSSWRRNQDYASEIRLWQSTVRVAPKNPRAQNNLGVAYESADRFSEARLAYTRALVLEPKYAAARKNLERATERDRRRLRP